MSAATLPCVAVIGCGAWGKNLVRNFAELGALAAVADADADRAALLAGQHGARALSVDDILADPAIAGVAIKALVKKLIEAELPAAPLADDVLVALLARRGVQVARRTVAKYREQLDIPPARQRGQAARAA